MKKNKLILVLGLAIAVLLVSANMVQGSTNQFDTPETYEENMFLPGLDIWVNQSASASQPAAPQPSELQSVDYGNQPPNARGWELVHYILFPDSVSIDDLIILDPNAVLIFGFLGRAVHDDDDGFFVKGAFALSEQKSEAGLTSFSNRDTDRVRGEEQSDLLSEDAAAIYDMTPEAWNSSTMDTLEQNYTVPESEITGVKYVAGDDKSVEEYAKDIASADGKIFYNVHNSTMLGFAFEDYEQLYAVSWAFDEAATLAAGQPGFSLKRARVWLHSAYDSGKKVAGVYGKTYKKIGTTAFKSIKTAGSGLAAIPSKAKYFFTKTIPSAFHRAKQWVGSLAKGIFGALRGLLPILLILGIIAIAIYMGIPQKLFKKR